MLKTDVIDTLVGVLNEGVESVLDGKLTEGVLVTLMIAVRDVVGEVFDSGLIDVVLLRLAVGRLTDGVLVGELT